MSDNFVADQYDTLRAGPRLLYSFEDQDSLPISGVNALLRDLSPFTLRLVVPQISSGGNGTSNFTPGLYGRAGQSTQTSANPPTVTDGLVGTNAHSVLPFYLTEIGAAIANGQFLSEMASSADKEVATLASPFSMLDFKYQVEAMLAYPPLTLLVNPEEFSITYNMVQEYAERGRNGFIFQRWGEQQPTVSIKGTTGAFIAGASSTNSYPQMTETNVATGVQFASKRNSTAFQYFTALYQFYRSNGMIYDTVNKTEAHLAVGAIAIDYDQMTYVGHIESFDYSYEDSTPHRIQWSMEFIVDAMYDVAQRPMVVLPLTAPQPNPAYPGRNTGSGATGVGGANNHADAKIGGWLGISGTGGGVSYGTNSATGEPEAQVDLESLAEYLFLGTDLPT